ncbi:MULTISPECIES: acyl carrier protein [Streptomyces]|uniref:acyl carrier protein n=1 Tax=Streptomyces TaxID=1883 RepID=UPI00068C9B04|nr:acyl carrier protein [Streptomyces sp. NRRL F-5193]
MTPPASVHASVVAIWSDALGVGPDELDADADFFLLGGHSLLATQMIARVERAHGVKLRLRDVLDHPFLGEFTELVARAASTASPAPAPADA